ncbi:MAG: aspartate-semialdehyde dehydrogenase [Candidatus Krumholzibacteriia bacterium]
MREYRVAVVGATGAVGVEMIHVLERRAFPVRELRAFASRRSAGRQVRFHDEAVTVCAIEPGCFRDVDFALFSAGADRSRQYAPQAVREGATVIDNSSAFRTELAVPLVVPEVNVADLESHQGLVANPNCSTIQLVIALRPVMQAFGLRRVVVSTYQSVSGAGARAMRELQEATRAHLDGHPEPREVYPRSIAFNVVPHIDVFDEQGNTREETKMRNETRRILGAPQLRVLATCVRVPVFRSHSEAVLAETRDPVDLATLRGRMREQPGLVLHEEHEDYPLARDAAERDEVFVGRVRTDSEEPCSVSMWVVSDNLLKGAALNAVQIAEHLCGAPLRP